VAGFSVGFSFFIRSLGADVGGAKLSPSVPLLFVREPGVHKGPPIFSSFDVEFVGRVSRVFSFPVDEIGHPKLFLWKHDLLVWQLL